MRIDDKVIAAGPAVEGLSAEVRLTAGVHAVKVETFDAPVTVEKVEIQKRIP